MFFQACLLSRCSIDLYWRLHPFHKGFLWSFVPYDVTMGRAVSNLNGMYCNSTSQIQIVIICTNLQIILTFAREHKVRWNYCIFYYCHTLLNHPGRLMHICVGKLGHHWSQRWLVASSTPSHYLNKLWSIKWIIRNNFLRNFHKNTTIFVRGNTFGNGVRKIVRLFVALMCYNSDEAMAVYQVNQAVSYQILYKNSHMGPTYAMQYMFFRTAYPCKMKTLFGCIYTFCSVSTFSYSLGVVSPTKYRSLNK